MRRSRRRPSRAPAPPCASRRCSHREHRGAPRATSARRRVSPERRAASTRVRCTASRWRVAAAEQVDLATDREQGVDGRPVVAVAEGGDRATDRCADLCRHHLRGDGGIGLAGDAVERRDQLAGSSRVAGGHEAHRGVHVVERVEAGHETARPRLREQLPAVTHGETIEVHAPEQRAGIAAARATDPPTRRGAAPGRTPRACARAPRPGAGTTRSATSCAR